MRTSITLLAFLVTVVGSSQASACCLTDWLCGRTPSPYVVGYAPVAVPYAANYPVSVPYAANYPVASSTALIQPTSGVDPGAVSGVYQAQRPAYFYDNPSVYTGAPVASPYAAGYAPFGGVYRGSVSDPSSYFGAANQYPTTYSSGYGAAQVPVPAQTPVAPGLPLSVSTPTGAPSYGIPATSVAAPVFQSTPPPQRGLGRFCGSMFNTNYRTSYYRAPVTYYRPATTVDPVTGTTVTVQQPCTSYVNQLQRTPYSGLQSPSSTYTQPSPGCTTGCDNSYSAAPAPSPYGSPSFNGIGQASASLPTGRGEYAVPIPSTMQPSTSTGGYYGPAGSAPNLSPLTGAPSEQPFGSQSDATPLNQPELRNRPPAYQNGYTPERPQSEPNGSERPQTKSYWELQNADDSSAMIRQSRPAQTAANPIQAPADYVSPFRQQLESSATPVNSKAFEAPPLPPRSFDSAKKAYDSNWSGTPVREASMSRQSSYHPLPVQASPAPIKRDTTWNPVSR